MDGELAVDGAGVGVEEQLVLVELKAASRIPRAVGAKSIQLTRPDARQIAVPDPEGALLKLNLGLAVAVEKAQYDRGGVRCGDGEVGALAVVGCAKVVTVSRPKFWGAGI